jgi:TonB family protein
MLTTTFHFDHKTAIALPGHAAVGAQNECNGLSSADSLFGQQNTKPSVRISCPLLYSHPIKIVRPTYPALARQTHVEGRVSRSCIVGSDGLVEKIEVQKGHPLLIQAATDAVSKWKFKPLVLNGKAVAMETVVNIDFRLPKDQKGTGGKAPADE